MANKVVCELKKDRRGSTGSLDDYIKRKWEWMEGEIERMDMEEAFRRSNKIIDEGGGAG